MTALPLILTALRELGPRQLGLYAGYKLGLQSGYFHWTTRQASIVPPGGLNVDWLVLPARQTLIDLVGDNGVAQTLAVANEILGGEVRLFGGAPVPLQLKLPGPLRHWTEYERAASTDITLGQSDPKFIWESGRFGWTYTLGRAYHLSADQRYAQSFWQYTEAFLDGNPAYLGPHWISAQEVALRLIAFVFALRVFGDSQQTTAKRKDLLAQAVADHAQRILPTLIYARAQNNNHLLTEAAGLYTASLALPEHANASRWRALGWRWFNRGILAQVRPDGVYTQHSTNYQRLMLQISLWMTKLTRAQGLSLPADVRQRLAASTRWLHTLLDPQSGCVPNLGPNDGAYIFPLTVHPFSDYRPVLQATSQAFMNRPTIEPGTWDEMACWLVDESVAQKDHTMTADREPCMEIVETPHTICLKKHHSWAYLRVAHFSGRPGHADQLHLDLWWRGLNLAQDPGTYLYNALPPWNNSLTSTQVHNTLTVNGQEQMLRVGRFLYLRRAQAQVLERRIDEHGDWQRLVAQHDGYRHIGLVHRRSVTGFETGQWVVEDHLQSLHERTPKAHDDSAQATLQWLLPDWDWAIDEGDGFEITVRLRSPYGQLRLVLSGQSAGQLQLVRAGERAYGLGEVEPVWGWSSPTYGDKIPALSLRWNVLGKLPLILRSEWTLP